MSTAMANGLQPCGLCGGPCRVLGMHSYAPRGTARQHQQRERARGLYAAWFAANQQHLTRRHVDVRRALESMALAQARTLAQRDAAGRQRLQVKLAAGEIDAMLHRLVTQLRRHRHGNLEHVGNGEWHAQVCAIASELGWRWPHPAPLDKPKPLQASHGLEAAVAVAGIAGAALSPHVAPAAAAGGA